MYPKDDLNFKWLHPVASPDGLGPKIGQLPPAIEFENGIELSQYKFQGTGRKGARGVYLLHYTVIYSIAIGDSASLKQCL